MASVGTGPHPPRSLLQRLASSHLPTSGATGPLVSASGGPVILARGCPGSRLLGRPLLGLAAPLPPTGQALLLLLGRQGVLAPGFGRRVCRSPEPVLGRGEQQWRCRGGRQEGAPTPLGPPRKSGVSPRRQCQLSQWWLPTRATTLSCPDPDRRARLVLSLHRRPPTQPTARAGLAPGPTHLCVGLEDVVLDSALGAELLRTQQAAVLPHQVVPLQDTCPTPTRGARRQTAASAGALGKGRSPLLRAPHPRPGQQAHLCPRRRGTPAGRTCDGLRAGPGGCQYPGPGWPSGTADPWLVEGADPQGWGYTSSV